MHPLISVGVDSAAHRATALRRAAVRAAQAPSVLNIQPWRLHIRAGALYVHLDRDRQLPALDPQRRILITSMGCAVLCARAALAADGYDAIVHRFPDPTDPTLTAVIRPGPPVHDASLSGAAATRDGSDRCEPGGVAADVPASVISDLRLAAAADGVSITVLDDAQRSLVAELNEQADRTQQLDPTYRAEVEAWATDDHHHRDRTAAAPQCLAVLSGAGDAPEDWLRAGEATMRAIRVAGAAGHALSPSTQVIEVAAARGRLRRALHLTGYPYMLLRAGRSYDTAAPRRRRLVDVLVEES